MRTIFFLFALLPVAASAQLSIIADSPQSLIRYTLLGPPYDATVNNIQYHGSQNAIAYFNANIVNMPFKRGIVLTTGTTVGPDGPQGPNNSDKAGTNNSAGGFSPLSSLVGSATYNAAYLEFDIVMQGDLFQLNYMFGSDEYPEFVGSDFNDVFAIFLSGPGTIGMENIAHLPDGAITAVNSMNNGSNNSGPCKNCQFYVYNGTGQDSPYNTSDQYLQYDGFTSPRVASHAVHPGQTYHVVIAIADVGDGVYDSGLFLEANSLVTGIDELNAQNKVTLSPNPVSDQLEIALATGTSFTHYEILDVSGQLVKQGAISGTTSVNTSDLETGIYFVHLVSSEGSVTKKIQKL